MSVLVPAPPVSDRASDSSPARTPPCDPTTITYRPSFLAEVIKDARRRVYLSPDEASMREASAQAHGALNALFELGMIDLASWLKESEALDVLFDRSAHSGYLLTCQQLCAQYVVSRTTWWRWTKRKGFPAGQRTGRAKRWDVRAVDDFLSRKGDELAQQELLA